MEFYNANEHRAYPFTDDASLVGTLDTEDYQMSNAVFVEARLTYTKPVVNGAVRLLSLRTAGVDLLLTLEIGGYPVEIAVGVAVPEVGRFWAARGFDETLGISWLFVFGNAIGNLLENIGTKTLVFTDPPQLLPTAVRDASRLRVVSLGCDGVQLRGSVRLKEGYNCGIEVTGNRVLLSATPGAGAGLACSEPSTGCGDVLFRLSGQTGKNIGLIGSGVVVTPRVGEHTIDISAASGADC